MSYNIISAVRQDKKDGKGLLPIYIYIYEGSRLVKKKSLKQKVHADFWDETTRRVTKKGPLSTLINSLIDKEISELKTKVLQEEITKGSVDISAMLNREKPK
jgi:hypothetical protein